MRALYLLLFMTLVSFGTTAAQSSCSDLFFSEYVEGSSGNNKCVEIYNPTGSTVDLNAGAYKVQVYANGSATPSNISLTGSVAAYGTYVLCNSGASSTLTALANQTSGSLSHNGDDALALVKGAGNTFVDIFGNIGNDPGAAWTSGALSTMDQVLRRKSSVQAGITTNPGGTGAGAFTTLGTEWDNFSDTDYSGFGTHTSTCVPATPCSITSISVSLSGTCNDNGTPLNSNDDYVGVNVCINYANRPMTGNLVVSGDVNFTVPAGFIGTVGHCSLGLTTPADGTPIIVTATFSDDPACTMTVSNVTAPMPCSVVPNCALPFFSEYIEGSGNNKCLEIYNPTASPIDLAAGGYKIEMYFNGSSGVGQTVNLAGVIQPGDVYVVCNSGAAPDFLAQADQIGGGGWYNGDDAVALVSNAGTLDVIGQIGVDPGTNWSSFGIETSEQTLRRYSFIQKGDNNGTDAYNPALQWETYPQNTFWGLGYHRTSCQPGLPFGWNPFNIGCSSGSVAYNAGQFTLSSDCYEDLSSGVDDHTLAFQEFCGDGEIITRMCGINGLGFAGLTFRESAAANSKQVSLLIQNSQNAHWFTRSATGAAMQFQSKPRQNRNWLRVTRTGNVFRGYISTNGSAWQLLFQSALDFEDCLFVGLITESNVDGANTTANFCNVNIIGSEGELSRPLHDGTTPINERLTAVSNNNSLSDMPEGANLFDNNDNNSELSIRPNPVVNELEVIIPSTIQAGAMLQIMDMNGKKLFSERVGEGSNLMRLNLSELNLSGGVYLLNIQDGETLLTRRFVKVN